MRHATIHTVFLCNSLTSTHFSRVCLSGHPVVKIRWAWAGKPGNYAECNSGCTLNQLSILFATFFMTIYLIFIDNSNPNYFDLMLDSNILLLGILCTAIATVIYFQILQTEGASFLSIMNFLIPLWAILFGIIVLSDQFSWNYIFGLLVILFGIKLANSNR